MLHHIHRRMLTKTLPLFLGWNSSYKNRRKNEQRKKQVHEQDFDNEHDGLTSELAA